MSDTINIRLNKIEGQIKGIRKMYKEGRDCMEIAQQVSASRSALAVVGQKILSDEAQRCAGSLKERDKFSKVVQQLFALS
jgi:DNA-binding FrmR family transcriptional regulator